MKTSAFNVFLCVSIIALLLLPLGVGAESSLHIEIFSDSVLVTGLDGGGQLALYAVVNNQKQLIKVYDVSGSQFTIYPDDIFPVGPIAERTITLTCTLFVTDNDPVESNTITWAYGYQIDPVPVYTLPSVVTYPSVPSVDSYPVIEPTVQQETSIVSLLSQLRYSSIWSLVVCGVTMFTTFALFGFVLNKVS